MSSRQKVDLKVDWCSYRAAKWAVEHWHYSDIFPTGKNNYLGVWEDAKYIGAVIFGLGASASLGKPYGLGTFEVCELLRVALNEHVVPVTRIIAKSLKMLKRKNGGLRLCVSFADPYYDHVGIIYQAGNWVYSGVGQAFVMYQLPSGKMVHERRFSGQGWNAPQPVPMGTRKVKMPPKHRYLYPLDRAMRRQIAPLAQPYQNVRAADGSNLATSRARRFDPDPSALKLNEPSGIGCDNVASGKIWERLRDEGGELEPNLWFDRFTDYRLMGAGRSLLGCVNQARAKKGKQKRNFIPGSWWDAFNKRNWKQRAEAWDEHLRQELEDEWADRRNEIKSREWKQAEKLLERVEKMLGYPLSEVIQTDEEGKTFTVKPVRWRQSDITRFLETASKLARLAAEMATDSRKLDVTSDGKQILGPVIFLPVVDGSGTNDEDTEDADAG